MKNLPFSGSSEEGIEASKTLMKEATVCLVYVACTVRTEQVVYPLKERIKGYVVQILISMCDHSLCRVPKSFYVAY